MEDIDYIYNSASEQAADWSYCRQSFNLNITIRTTIGKQVKEEPDRLSYRRIIRVYYYNHKGEEITRYFIDENHLILSGHTIEEMYTPSEYLSALRIAPWSKTGLEGNCRYHHRVGCYSSKITAKYHKEKIVRRSELVSQDAVPGFVILTL